MTTIVYRDGVMAADSRAWSGDTCPIGHKRKIRRLKDGSLVGVTTGLPGLSEAFMAWLENGADIDAPVTEKFNLSALHVLPSGEVYFYNDSAYPAGPLTAAYFAIGSGERYAIGALEMGAGAVRAVEVACVADTVSEGPLTILKLNESDADDR